MHFKITSVVDFTLPTSSGVKNPSPHVSRPRQVRDKAARQLYPQMMLNLSSLCYLLQKKRCIM